MMSLSASRTRRASEGTTSGKRGRPESLVRQFWEDIDVEGVGPKCIFCDHRSVTRVFRAPPATRHTLICKNAPEHVKARLRRVTNNKYSRRPPVPTDASAAAAAAAAAAVAVAGNAPQEQTPHHQVQHPVQAQPQVQQLEQPQHSQAQPPPPVHSTSQPAHHTPPQQQPPQQPQQFAFKPPATGPEQAHQDPNALQNMSSPRHITAGVVTGMNVASPTTMHTGAVESVVPMRTALLNDRTRAVAHGGVLSPATADMLYANNQRMLAQDDMTNGLDRANAALAAAVTEALFTGPSRKKEGAVPTPAEFRAALQEAKENARNKAKRQRNDARAEVTRLQSAIQYLVGSKSVNSARGNDMESDDSDDEHQGVVGQVGTGRRGDWSNGYERK